MNTMGTACFLCWWMWVRSGLIEADNVTHPVLHYRHPGNCPHLCSGVYTVHGRGCHSCKVSPLDQKATATIPAWSFVTDTLRLALVHVDVSICMKELPWRVLHKWIWILFLFKLPRLWALVNCAHDIQARLFAQEIKVSLATMLETTRYSMWKDCGCVCIHYSTVWFNT